METKSIFKSKTYWGLAIAALCSVINNRTGVNVADQVGPLQQAIQNLINDLPPVISQLGIIVGIVLNLVGRFRATQPLHILPPSDPSSPTGSPFNSPVTNIALLALSLSILTGCSSANGGSAGPLPPSSGATVTGSTTAVKSTAMKTWVDNNWLIFYDAGFYGGQSYTAFAKSSGATKAQINSDYVVINDGFSLAITGGARTSDQIVADIQKAHGKVTGTSQSIASVGSVLTPFLAPAIALLGNDTQAVVEALGLISKGLADQATSSGAATVNPYASPSTTLWIPEGNDTGDLVTVSF